MANEPARLSLKCALIDCAPQAAVEAGRPGAGWLSYLAAQSLPDGQLRLGLAVPAASLAANEECFAALPAGLSAEPERLLAWAMLLRVLQAVRAAAIAPGESVGVLGDTLLAELTACFVREFTWAGQVVTIKTRAERSDASVQALLDTTGDNPGLAAALAGVAPRGRVICLAPAYPSGQAFNFYPDIHKHSLTILPARGVFSAGDPERLASLLNFYSQPGWFCSLVEQIGWLPKIHLAGLSSQLTNQAANGKTDESRRWILLP